MKNKSTSIGIKQLFVYFFKALKFLLLLIPKLAATLYRRIVERLRFSISFKITTAYTLMFMLLIFILNLAIVGTSAAIIGRYTEDALLKDSSVIKSHMTSSTVLPQKDLTLISEASEIGIKINDEKGTVIYDTNSGKPSEEPALNEFHFNTESKSNGVNIKYYSNKFVADYIDTVHTGYGDFDIGLSKEITFIHQYLGLFVVVLLTADIIFILIMMGTASKTSRKLLLPIKKMTENVKAISINALDTRLDVSGSKDELKDLAKTFNDMLDRIQRSYETQNQFVSDASHELRTPISVIQGYANMLDRWGKEDRAVLEESITAIKTEAENMKNLVEQLLFLARSDKNTQKVEKTEFLINELIEELVRETKLIDSKHQIRNERNEVLRVNGDRNLIKEALRVFIDNSIKYTQELGTIELNSYKEESSLILEVKDTGNGISKEDLPHIFERFYRADKSRTKETGGTGLGLSIAKWIVLKHKGTIEVESFPGNGTKIKVILPILL